MIKAGKFIISQNGRLRFGAVGRHKDLLLQNENNCHGGGHYLYEKEQISLFGYSYDFGEPQFEFLIDIENIDMDFRKTIVYYPF